MGQRIRNILGLFVVLFFAEVQSIVLFDAAPPSSPAFIDYSSIEPKVISGGMSSGDSLQAKEIPEDVVDPWENNLSGGGRSDVLGLLGPQNLLTKPNVVRRNYLRFGKKRSQPKNPTGLERRDYREFVRFGKRSPAQVNNKSFLRFGRSSSSTKSTPSPNAEDPLDEIWSRLSRDELKALGKRVNDYLRFG